MKMISFAVKKGGVGKTTLCKNIAYKLALENKKILLIDLDPQATLSMQMIDDQIKVNNTLIKVIPSPDMIKLDKIIQKTKYKNIDIILGGESLNKSSDVIKNFYDEKDRFLIAEYIYKENEYIFASYDYVLIDYPPTINDLALNFLILSDLIIIPVNDGLGSFKGLIDLKNTLNYICQKEQRKIGKILITLNNIKSDNNTQQINNWIYENKFTELLAKSIIKHSKSFINTENDLSSIWTNPYYWRQKQAYEELIAEII